MKRFAESVSDLEVYTSSFALQQEIFKLTRSWPPEERYALIDQIRRASRSIGANISEAWAKRRYEAHFVSKLTDADGELAETRHWLSTSLACGYLTEIVHAGLLAQADQIGRMLGNMLAEPDRWVIAPPSKR